MIAMAFARQHHRRHRRHAGRKRHRGIGAFQRRQALLEASDRWVVQAGIDRIGRLAIAGNQRIKTVGADP